MIVQIEVNENGPVRVGTNQEVPPALLVMILLDTAKMVLMSTAEKKPDIVVPTIVPR